jgi:hypothetical protein
MNDIKSNPLYKDINWKVVSTGHYAVVDPSSSSAILYLSNNQYLSLVRVALSNDQELIILARPGEVGPSSGASAPLPSNSSPPKGFRDFMSSIEALGIEKIDGLLDLVFRKKNRSIDLRRMSKIPLDGHPVYKVLTFWGEQMHMWT